MKQITKYILEVPAENLKRNLASNYIDILRDELESEEDMEQFTSNLSRFQDDMDSIDKHGFAGLFKDGMTGMLLNDTDFQDVEKYFQKTPEEDLEIVIVYPNGKKEVITKEDINY